MKSMADICAHAAVKAIESADDGGLFAVRGLGDVFKVVASWGGGWDHVSVSLPNRTPTFMEMDRIKRIFFRDDETAVQFHVPPSQHVNIHPHCLHLWRQQESEIVLPPVEFV